ncbi:MAG: hypothetical protein II980_06085 [Clostridia bacterium]|nr:hypothetical protein [Clostridia bacterium]
MGYTKFKTTARVGTLCTPHFSSLDKIAEQITSAGVSATTFKMHACKYKATVCMYVRPFSNVIVYIQ